VIDEFEEFLHSTKTADQLSEGLLAEISHPSGLEAPTLAALAAGRDVLVAGSAGSGKTHLLRQISRMAEATGLRLRWPNEDAATGTYVEVIPDVTEVPATRRGRILDRSANQSATIAAINEGPLLDLARAKKGAFASGLHLLHLAQRGVRGPHDTAAPVIVDAGSFDPVSAGIPQRILGSDLLAAAVDRVPCGCEDPAICPRRRAWKSLKSAVTIDRVGHILELLPDTQRIDFRAIWDFIEDVATGGDCLQDPPTSPWFWRLFFGHSSLSSKLREVASPEYAAFPRQEARLWYGDWAEVESEIQRADPARALLHLDTVPESGSPDSSAMLWVKAQLSVLSADFAPIGLVRDAGERQVAQAIEEQDAAALLETLNRYMTYQMITEPQRLSLNLWIDLGVEMRTERPRGHVSLGAAPVSAFRPTKSLAIVNHPDSAVSVFGARRYLVHEASGASLPLTGDFVALLLRGRSYRTAERMHTDAEWKIRRFFFQIAQFAAAASQLKVIAFDFDLMAQKLHTYTIANGIVQVEH